MFNILQKQLTTRQANNYYKILARIICDKQTTQFALDVTKTVIIANVIGWLHHGTGGYRLALDKLD